MYSSNKLSQLFHVSRSWYSREQWNPNSVPPVPLSCCTCCSQPGRQLSATSCRSDSVTQVPTESFSSTQSTVIIPPFSGPPVSGRPSGSASKPYGSVSDRADPVWGCACSVSGPGCQPVSLPAALFHLAGTVSTAATPFPPSAAPSVPSFPWIGRPCPRRRPHCPPSSSWFWIVQQNAAISRRCCPQSPARAAASPATATSLSAAAAAGSATRSTARAATARAGSPGLQRSSGRPTATAVTSQRGSTQRPNCRRPREVAILTLHTRSFCF